MEIVEEIGVEKPIELVHDEKYIKKYIGFTKNYILYRFNQWFVSVQKEGTLLPEHVDKLTLMLSKVKYEQPIDKEIDFYLNQPNTHMLHLAKYVYDRPEQLLNNTRRAIFSFIDHDKIYTEDIGATYLFRDEFIKPLIEEVLIENPSDKINVCEIGAGTGGLTINILPILYKNINRYIISDISRAFTRNLKRKLTSYEDKTKYETWNITNKKPYSDKPYDLIIASNVLHSVPDIEEALSNIYDSLNTGGYFLLHETTHGYLSNLAIWGFLKELWSYTDAHVRTDGAFLSTDDWQVLMKKAGFKLVSTKDDECLQTMFLFKKEDNE